jgi:hypothetical protein
VVAWSDNGVISGCGLSPKRRYGPTYAGFEDPTRHRHRHHPLIARLAACCSRRSTTEELSEDRVFEGRPGDQQAAFPTRSSAQSRFGPFLPRRACRRSSTPHAPRCRGPDRSPLASSRPVALPGSEGHQRRARSRNRLSSNGSSWAPRGDMFARKSRVTGVPTPGASAMKAEVAAR